MLDKLRSVKLKYSKLETSNVSELAASGLDMLMIKIKTARRKLTQFQRIADVWKRISGRQSAGSSRTLGPETYANCRTSSNDR